MVLCWSTIYQWSSIRHSAWWTAATTAPLPWASLVAQRLKHLPPMRETRVQSLGSIPGFNPWVGKIPWRRKWQPTPVFLPGDSSLVGCSTHGRKESDTTEWLHFHFTHGHGCPFPHWLWAWPNDLLCGALAGILQETEKCLHTRARSLGTFGSLQW